MNIEKFKLKLLLCLCENSLKEMNKNMCKNLPRFVIPAVSFEVVFRLLRCFA